MKFVNIVEAWTLELEKRYYRKMFQGEKCVENWQECKENDVM